MNIKIGPPFKFQKNRMTEKMTYEKERIKSNAMKKLNVYA